MPSSEGDRPKEAQTRAIYARNLPDENIGAVAAAEGTVDTREFQERKETSPEFAITQQQERLNRFMHDNI